MIDLDQAFRVLAFGATVLILPLYALVKSHYQDLCENEDKRRRFLRLSELDGGEKLTNTTRPKNGSSSIFRQRSTSDLTTSMWLKKRSLDRIARNVEGTHEA